MDDRLKKQLEFIVEIDKVKSIFRKNKLFDSSRNENDAEHAWHISIMALILSEYANDKNIDISKVIKMLLIHDLVEIDAGDVFLYDTKGRIDNKANEIKAAERIFGLLPEDQKYEMISLWTEFEEKKTSEAKFAAAMDRIEPVMANYLTEGYVWKTFNVPYEKVVSTNEHIRNGSETLWNYIKSIIDDSLRKDYLKKTV